MKPKVNVRKGGKYAEAREWAYDLIANSTGTTASEMAEMMAEQFKLPKSVMGHTLLGLVTNGSLKVMGHTTRKGKRTYVLAAVRRAKPTHDIPPIQVDPPPPAPTTNGSGVSVVIDTAAGQVTLTVEQAKAVAATLGVLFK